MTEQIANKTVRIRKKHQCFSCLRTFQVGTKMNNWVGKVDGDFTSVYSCMSCVEVMNMRQDPDEASFPEGFVFEMLGKNETPEELIKRLNSND